MAQFFPSKIPSNIVNSERIAWNSLENLDDTWHVFHSVKWQSLRGDRQGDGEADFILLHQNYGIIVLEVKGGTIGVDRGEWYSISESGNRFAIKNPFHQASDTKYALLTHLKERGIDTRQVPIVHGVVFPAATYIDEIGMYGGREIVIDRLKLRDIKGAIKTLTDHWGFRAAISSEDRKALIALLSPTIEIRTRLFDRIDDATEKILKLTEKQYEILNNLRYIRRAIILGGAGTGKTVLAIERARRFLTEGLQVLLTCYNAPLAAHIRSQIPESENLEVRTYHSFCISQFRKAGIHVPPNPNESWWDEESSFLLLEALERNGTKFDALIVDEGQDFSELWFDSLATSGKHGSETPFYIFADINQDVYRRSCQLPKGWPTFPLDTNCRNTVEICGLFKNIFPCEIKNAGVYGPKPVLVDCNVKDDGIRLAQNISIRLIKEEKVNPQQLVVLSDDHRFVEELCLNMAGEHPFTSLEGRGVKAETVRRFKGLESDAVILVLMSNFSELGREVLYTGLSRARSYLLVIADKETINTLKSIRDGRLN